MKTMTIEELYDYLCSPQFLDEKSGNIFYNYYIYQYPANKEYEMRRQIQEFKQKLEDNQKKWIDNIEHGFTNTEGTSGVDADTKD